MCAMTNIRINASTRYDVSVGTGASEAVVDFIRSTLPRVNKVAVVTDGNVDALHSDALVSRLSEARLSPVKFVFQAGEKSKNLATYASIIDFLAESGFSVWLVLPFCLPDEYHSPYKSYSAFGGNPYFIDLPTLRAKGLLTAEELESARQRSPYLCEFDRLSSDRLPLLALAASRLSEEERDRVNALLEKIPELARAAEFLALKKANRDLPWQEWTVREANEADLALWRFIQ